MPGSTPSIQLDHFYAYDEIKAFALILTGAYPDLCRLSSIGKSREGREIFLLTLTDFTTGEAEDRPAYVAYGGIHAHEPASAHGPFYTALKLLENHQAGGILERIVFYLIPRLCPDASEFCIETSTRVRSRTDFNDRAPNTIYPEDLNGDGLILNIRQAHPDGDLVADPADSRLLIQRRADSPGPYYRVLPEGLVHDWDGSDRVLMGGLHAFYPQKPERMGGRYFDWNRNWSYNWRTEAEQQGSGDFPFSEPEMRHFARFLHSHTKIFGLLGYHCGHASIIRPPASGVIDDLDLADDQVMEELANKGEAYLDVPRLMLFDPSSGDQRYKGKGGHSLDFGYHHLGIFGFEIELGTIMNAAGLKTEDFLEWTGEEDGDRWMRRLMTWWDDRGRKDTLFEPWRSFDHPQLGAVELGGFHWTVLDNPLVSVLAPTLDGAYRFTVEHARRHPHTVMEDISVIRFDTRTYRIRMRIANRGQWPTHVTSKGKTLKRMKTVKTGFRPATGVKLLSNAGHMDLGHLPGVVGSRVVEWFVLVDEEYEGRVLGELAVSGGTGGDIRCTVKN